jgi:hypothetical protein
MPGCELGMVVHACSTSDGGESLSEAGLWPQNARPCQKEAKAKKAGGVAHIIKCSHSKHRP